MVIWLIGLAGAGKTSIGKEVYKLVRNEDRSTVFLDGDRFREIMGDDLGHSLADREKNGWRMCKLSAWLERQDINIVACVLSNFPEQQKWNRENLDKYFEVYIEVSMDMLETRDQKGLYSGAKEGRIKNVIGVDLEFHPPENSDLVIQNSESTVNVIALAKQIVSKLDLNENQVLE